MQSIAQDWLIFDLTHSSAAVGVTMALQFLLAGAKAGETGIYISLAETEQELRDGARSHGWDLAGIEVCNLARVVPGLAEDSSYSFFSPDDIELADITRAIQEAVSRIEPERRAVLERFAAAVENADASALAELLAADVALEMPQVLTWFVGRQAVASFFASQPFVGPGRLRLVPVMANGQPSFASYVREPDGTYHAHAVTVPTLTAAGIESRPGRSPRRTPLHTLPAVDGEN